MDQLKRLLDTYRTDANLAFLTLEHLTGEGDWSKGQDQATLIPSKVLKEISEAARNAFYKVPTPGISALRFATIKQKPGEDICQFVRRVQTLVERKIKDKEARQETIISIVSSNANPACRQTILALPRHLPPTLDEILEACMDCPTEPIHQLSSRFNFKKKDKPVETLITQQQQGTKSGTMKGTQAVRCFFCNGFGHISKYCPKKIGNNANSRDCFSDPKKNCSGASLNEQ